MTIRISRNETGNCINFIGSTNPSYWNACLSASLNQDDATRVDIINDIRSENSATIQYEFYAVDPNDFSDKDGNSFPTPQDMVDYINVNANVSGVSDVGADLTGVDVNFRLDATSTSIILDNGSAFGVNTIKAVANADGTIHLHAIGAGSPDGAEDAGEHRHFEKLEHTRVSVNGTAAAGGLNDVVNLLNELFTVGAFESVVIADPYSTMIADVAGVNANGALAGEAINPATADVAGATATHNNKYGWLSSDTIDQAGEYFTFDIRVEGTIGMGLVCADAADVVGNATYGNPATFCNGAVNSSHYGYQFAHYFHPTPNGPWTNYGANTGYVAGPGWSNVTHRFMSSPEGADWLAGNPVKMRVGIDTNGFISIDYYDASESTWIVCARTSYPTAQGVAYKLGIKFADSNVRLFSAPKIHELAPAAPTMYFRYIESPDGNFEWPLFATEEEANYYDLNHGGTVGTGTSHTHTYADDPTNTTWYMADTGSTMTDTAAPSGVTFAGAPVTFTEITSLTDADLTPPAFSNSNISQEEGTAVNIAVAPAGATWSTSVTISPSGSGLVYDGYSLIQGTLTDVGADTDYTITVVRANSYGSSTGTMTVTATDVAPTQTMITPWTKALNFSGSNEHLKQVTQSTGSNAIRMSGFSSLAVANSDLSKSSADSLARPWATAIVFQTPNNTSNQHIWNSGEGAGTNDDNIYLRITGSSGELYFGWGREGVGYNECKISNIGGSYNQSTGQWWGIYIAHKGQRFNATDATAQNLADAFDIKLMGTNDTVPMGGIYTVGETAADWTSTGVRMDRAVTGDFAIGGRGANRSFHGKVASMVVTTLRRDYAMPSAAEAELMLTDPKKWEDDYRVGQTVRANNSGSNTTYDVTNGKYGTQIWLMGDGTSDSYSNGIRNQVDPTDQNYTKLQLNSMVSNDIETVSIAGLT